MFRFTINFFINKYITYYWNWFSKKEKSLLWKILYFPTFVLVKKVSWFEFFQHTQSFSIPFFIQFYHGFRFIYVIYTFIFNWCFTLFLIYNLRDHLPIHYQMPIVMIQRSSSFKIWMITLNTGVERWHKWIHLCSSSFFFSEKSLLKIHNTNMFLKKTKIETYVKF